MKNNKGWFKKGYTPWNKGLILSHNYSAIHARLYRGFERQGICERCGIKETRIEWSNNGKYDTNDKSDWEELCVSCHRKKDVTDDFRNKQKVNIMIIKPWVSNERKVMMISKTGKETAWNSINSAARSLGIWDTSVANCLHGRSKTAGGFVWKYV